MKMKKRLSTLIIVLFFTLSAGLAVLPLSPQETKSEEGYDSIVENVTVSNIQLPVRVFKGKQPVDGLTREDFHLYINGKTVEINGFYQLRKKLQLNASDGDSGSAPSAAPLPRTFILMFNLSDYHQDLTPMLDYFFEKVVRPGDRIMAISNIHFFPEWEVTSPETTKAQILKIIAKEVKRMRGNITRFEVELRVAAATFKSDIAFAQQTGAPVSPIFQEFFRTHQFVMEDMKTQFLSLPVEEYIKTAEYLKSRSGDKYVFNFFQVGRIPMLDTFGEIQQIVNGYSGQEGQGESDVSRLVKRLVRDLAFDIVDVEDLLVKDISKAFLNSGAAFHTMLLKPVQPGFSRDFKYSPVATDTETILKRLSHLTGGSVSSSNKMTAFARKFTAKEDIIYMLTYVPPAVQKKNKLMLTVGGKRKYRLVYDNQKRIKAFRMAKNKVDKKKPALEIAKLSYAGAKLNVQLNNIQMVDYEDETFGAVKARIKVMGKNNQIIAKINKTYRGIKESGVLQVDLPKLTRGKYDIVLEVKDLFSMDNRFVGDAITVSRK
ncbi:MAG: hypothetical protein GY940_14670 [bacterium]|nr:hypothetical protein [bacterium]